MARHPEGTRDERQEWLLLETAQVWTDNLLELKRKGVMTDDDLRELERQYGYWAAHLALSHGQPIFLARRGHIEASKRKVFEYARQVSRNQQQHRQQRGIVCWISKMEKRLQSLEQRNEKGNGRGIKNEATD